MWLRGGGLEGVQIAFLMTLHQSTVVINETPFLEKIPYTKEGFYAILSYVFP